MTTIILGTALNGDMGLSLKDRKICFCSMIEQSYLDKATYDSLYIKEPRLQCGQTGFSTEMVRSFTFCCCKGAYLYDVCSGLGRGVPKKQTKGTRLCELCICQGGRGSTNQKKIFADVI